MDQNPYESRKRLLRFALGLGAYVLSCGFVTWFFLPMSESLEVNMAILVGAMSIGGFLFLYQHAKKTTA